MADDLRDAHEGASDGPFMTYEDNPERQMSVTGGVKDNRNKPMVDLLSTQALLEVAKVLAYGTRKYKPHNWRLGLSWSQTYASAMRHLLAFNDGEDLDPETGLPHLAHAICQVMFLLEYTLTGNGTDDRWSTVKEQLGKPQAEEAAETDPVHAVYAASAGQHPAG